METVNFDRKHKRKGRWNDHELSDQVITKLVFSISYKTSNGKSSVKVWWGRKMPVSLEKTTVQRSGIIHSLETIFNEQ